MEKIILQENVSQFPSSKISQLLGCLYHIDHAVLCPSELGWPVTRPRKWHVLRHRYKTGAFASPLNMFTRIFCRPPSWHNNLVPHWDIFFAANINDLMDEIAWASRRPESSARDMANPDVLKDDWNSMTPDGAYYQSLTKFEQANLQNYIQKQPQQAYSLNQNSNVQPTVSRWDVLRTLTKNGGILWQLGQVSTWQDIGDIGFMLGCSCRTTITGARGQKEPKEQHAQKQHFVARPCLPVQNQCRTSGEHWHVGASTPLLLENAFIT